MEIFRHPKFTFQGVSFGDHDSVIVESLSRLKVPRKPIYLGLHFDITTGIVTITLNGSFLSKKSCPDGTKYNLFCCSENRDVWFHWKLGKEQWVFHKKEILCKSFGKDEFR
jgi:hypothetical protein